MTRYSQILMTLYERKQADVDGVRSIDRTVTSRARVTTVRRTNVVTRSRSTRSSNGPTSHELPLVTHVCNVIVLVRNIIALPVVIVSYLCTVRTTLSNGLTFNTLGLAAVLSIVRTTILLISATYLTVFNVLLVLGGHQRVTR